MRCVGASRRIVVGAAAVFALVLTQAASAGATGKAAGLKLSPATLKGGTAGASYRQVVKAAGGVGEYHWHLVSGGLPSGVTINEAEAAAGRIVLEGEPLQAGASTFTLEASDSSTPTPRTITHEYTLGVQIALNPGSLGKATVGREFARTLTSAGGTAPYKFTLSSGLLPEGLELLETGALRGTPTQAGTSTFTVAVADSSEPPFLREREYTLQVQLGLAPRSEPVGTVGEPYEGEAFNAFGGEGPYSYEVVSGELPPGLHLEGDHVLGTPEKEGVYPFVLQASDSAVPAHTGRHHYTIVVKPGSGPPLGSWRLEYRTASEPENPQFDGFTLEAGGKLHDEDGAPGHWTYHATGHLTFTLELAGGSVVYEYVGAGSGPAGPFSGSYTLNGTAEGTFTFTHE